MREKARRTAYYEGTPREIGREAGRRLGKRLERNIEYYLRNRPIRPETPDPARLYAEAIPLLRTLPARFQEELEGLAEGSGLPLQKVAEWCAIERLVKDGCSGFISIIDGHAWLGRNNDSRAPAVWGNASVKSVKNRIPTISFGMEGDAFTTTGINKERLWLHYQYLPAADKPRKDKRHLPAHALLTEALETCTGIKEVERLLAATEREGGMILFAVDGKTDEVAIFECNCRKYKRRNPIEGRLMVTNHTSHTRHSSISESSASRLQRLTETVGNKGWAGATIPDDLIAVLADDRIEQRDKQHFITVESAVACPAQKKIWFTFGGYPAASCGNWRPLEWPWQEG